MRLACSLALPLLAVAVAASGLEFQAREEIAVGASNRQVVPAKLNGDALTDYVVATNAGLAVLLGARDARVATATLTRTASAPTTLVAGDFDGDGWTDVAFASTTEPAVHIRYGNGDGSFRDRTELPISARVLFLHSADLDGDGKSDLFIGDRDGIQVRRSRGRGQFGEPETVDTQGVEGRWFTTADMDRDGHLEIVLLEAAGEAVGVFEAGSDGSFHPRQASFVGNDPRTAAMADIDGDGRLDLIVADAVGLVWVRGDGKARFTDPTRLLRSDDISAVIAFDANADGAIDIVATDSRRGIVHVLINTGGGKFDRRFSYLVAPTPESLLATDATGDGVPDLLVTSRTSSALTLCRGRGDGTFHGQPAFDLGPDPFVGVAYDANGDGHLDLAIAHREAAVVTLSLGDGHGNFRLHASMPVGSDPRALALGNFDADPAPDLVVANFASDDVAVLSGTSRGELVAPLFLATGLGPAAVAVADFDRDGHDDIAVANTLSNSVSVLFSDGTGRFPRTNNYPVLPKPDFVLAGNLDGTGNTDLIVGNMRSERVSILHGSAAGLSDPVEDSFSNRVRPVISGDFDGDGTPDVVRVEEGEDKVAILRGRREGGLGLPDKFAVGRQPSGAVPGDFDEDGKADLVVLHRRTRTVAFLRNLTAKGASAAEAPPATITPGELADPWRQAIGAW